jgi:hypothetical protein
MESENDAPTANPSEFSVRFIENEIIYKYLMNIGLIKGFVLTHYKISFTAPEKYINLIITLKIRKIKNK